MTPIYSTPANSLPNKSLQTDNNFGYNQTVFTALRFLQIKANKVPSWPRHADSQHN